MAEVSAVRARALSAPPRVNVEELLRRWDAMKSQRALWEYD